MPPLWIDTSQDALEFSPATIRCWAVVAASVNLAFIALVIFLA